MSRKSRNKTKRQRGSALSILLVFVTVLMVLGVGMLSVANNRAVHTAAAVKLDKQFYAAESAAQLAAQMLMRELKEDYFYKPGDVSQPTDMIRLRNEFDTQLNGRLEAIREKINNELAKTKFNGESAELEPLEIRDLEFPATPFDPLKLPLNEKDDGGKGAVYLENPTFILTTKAGARSVTAEVAWDFDLDIVPGSSGSDGILPHLGGLQFDKSGGIYGDNNNDLYDYYMAELNKLLNKTDTEYNTVKNKEGDIINEPDFTNNSTYEAFDWNKALTATNLNVHGVVTLGKAGQPTEYPNLEYIKSGNSLVILGTVKCPKLKGVAVTGADIRGTFYCPSLENFYSRGGNMTIYAGAAINPMGVDAAGNITDMNKPTASCNFFCDEVLYINCSTEINWCRFNVRQIAINYGTKGKLTSNSIFVSRDWLKISGTASSDTSRVIPQFYARGYIDFTGSNPGSVTGIFMTSSNQFIFNNGNGLPDNTEFTGLFVGNCDKNYQQLPPPVYGAHNVPIGMYDKNGNPRDDFEVNDFDPVTSGLIMDGDWLTGDSGSSGTSGSDTEVTFTCSFRNLSIRESVGK